MTGQDWPNMIAATIARQLTVANGGDPDDAPTLDYDENDGGWYFAIDTPGGRMRIQVSPDA